MIRLPTPLAFKTYAPGKYMSSAAGILIPADQTFFIARASRPNPLLGEDPWPDLGKGGVQDTHTFDNEKTQSLVGGLDTEVFRGYFYISLDDGATWLPWGHIGTGGGHIFDRRGDPVLDSLYVGELPDVGNPKRRIQMVVDVREALATKVEIDLDNKPLPPVLKRDDHHSIAVESVSGALALAASSVTSSGNVTPAGSNRYMVAVGGNDAVAAAGTYTSIVFGGATMSKVTDNTFTVYDRYVMSDLVAPSTTPATVTYTVSSTDTALVVGAVAFSGVDQSTPRDTPAAFANGTDAAPTITIAAGDAGDVRIAGVYARDASSITVGANETSRLEIEPGTYQGCLGISTKEDGGSDAMNWTKPLSGRWAMDGWNINVAAAGGTFAPYFYRQHIAGGMHGESA